MRAAATAIPVRVPVEHEARASRMRSRLAAAIGEPLRRLASAAAHRGSRSVLTHSRTRRIAACVAVGCLLCALGAVPASAQAPDGRATLELDGAWQFRTDAQQVGEREGWAATSASASASAPASWADARTIQVPGAWQAQGVGEPSGILRHHYAGDAWYRRTVAVPASWKGRRVLLTIGGAHRSTRLFVNGKTIGSHDGFSAPFEFDVSEAIVPGRDNAIVLRVSNPGATDLASPDKQAGAQATGMLNYIANWGGIYSHVRLVATERVWIDRVLIVPDAEHKSARVEVSLGSREPALLRGARVSVRLAEAAVSGPANTKAPATTTDSASSTGTDSASAKRVAAAGTSASVVTLAASDASPLTNTGTIDMASASLWTPEDPHLYTASITLTDARGRALDRVDQRIGLRTIATRGTTLLLNGKPLYLRGYGDDNIEMLTGFPPASKAIYRERLTRAKAYGFNAVRFHSMTPVHEFFEAADEIGMLVMAELPAAYTQYVLPHKALLRDELSRTLLAYRNHPSLLSLAFGNEFNLGWLKTEDEKREFLATIADFYQLAKSLDPTRPIMATDGLHVEPTDMVSLYNGYADRVPTLRHEFGQYYCSLPDPSLIPRFTGAVEPTWLIAKQQWVASHALTPAYPLYVRNSQQLQQLGQAFQIEAVRRDPRVTGYHYWLIADYPGGTGEGDSWEEGWFDYFWQPKAAPPDAGKRLNGAVLPLIDAGVDQRTFWSAQGKSIQVSISNYGDAPLLNAPASWRWIAASDGRVLATGETQVNVPLGEVKPAFTAALTAPPAAPLTAPGEQAEAVDLEVEITLPGSRERATNRWRFWRVPKPVSAISLASGRATVGDLLITTTLDDEAKALLEKGGRVLLLAEPAPLPANADEAAKKKRRASAMTFFPGNGAAIGTIVRDHPSLDGLPHDGFADLQFYNLMQGAATLTLDDAPRDFEPVIDAVRTATGWLSKSKDLTRSGFLIEAKLGANGGRLLATTFNVRAQLDDAHPDVVSFLDRLIRYASSDRFAPRATLTWAQLHAMMAPLEGSAP